MVKREIKGEKEVGKDWSLWERACAMIFVKKSVYELRICWHATRFQHWKCSVFCSSSVCGPSSIDQSGLSWIWLHAGKQSIRDSRRHYVSAET